MEKFFSNGKYRLKKFVLGQLKTNCYLIVDKNDDCAIVDPGACDPALTEWIRANGINPRFVLLTHGHFDHVLGLKQFLSLPAYIHEFDKEMLDSSKKSSANFFNKDIEYNEENLITFSDGFKIPFATLPATPKAVQHICFQIKLCSLETQFLQGRLADMICLGEAKKKQSKPFKKLRI